MFLDRIFFTLLLIFLPTQLGKHFFADFSLVQGVFVDYLIPTIYLTDILIFFLFLSFLLRKKTQIFKIIKLKKRLNKLVWLTVILTGINLLLIAAFKEVALYKLIKIIQLLFLYGYIKEEKISMNFSIKPLLIAAFYTCLLAIFQFIKKGSIGGMWWFLGERTFSLQTPGIAKAIIFGQLILRPYATFSHPNVLAGFLALALPLLIYEIEKEKNKTSLIIYYFLLTLFLGTCFLTFSRTGISVALTGFIAAVFVSKKKLISLILLLTTTILFASHVFGRFQALFQGMEETLFQRQELVKAALSMIKTSPIFGVGLNNFLPSLPFYSAFAKNQGFFQPVHNTFLLIASETGMIGLFLFAYLIFQTIRAIKEKKHPRQTFFLISLGQIMILLFFDHYFYTLQQGLILLTILISFMMNKEQDYA